MTLTRPPPPVAEDLPADHSIVTYRSASHSERQRVHAALAEVINPDRAWHRVQARPGRTRSSGGAGMLGEPGVVRGAMAAAAAFLERSMLLTADPARRAERTLGAAQVVKVERPQRSPGWYRGRHRH